MFRSEAGTYSMIKYRFNALTMTRDRDRLHMKHKGPQRSAIEGQTQAISAQDRAGQAEKYGKAQGTLDQFEGPVNKSPFYKALLTAGTDSTANAYQSAKTNVRARSKAAGFGEDSGAGQGAEAGIDSQEAKAQAAVPGEALMQATGPALSAAGQTAGMGNALGGQGVAYSGQAVDLEKQYQQAQMARQQAMWGALSSVAGAGATAYAGR